MEALGGVSLLPCGLFRKGVHSKDRQKEEKASASKSMANV